MNEKYEIKGQPILKRRPTIDNSGGFYNNPRLRK
jgi:hypothetical protein